MATFFVGQRVRLVRSVSGRGGLTGRIRTTTVEWVDEGHFDCYVDWDNGQRDGPLDLGYSGYATSFWQLEPILPEGHREGRKGECEELDRLLEREGVQA